MNPTPEQLAAFQRGTASTFNPDSWLDRNKMQALMSGSTDRSDTGLARSRGQDWTGPEPSLMSQLPGLNVAKRKPAFQPIDNLDEMEELARIDAARQATPSIDNFAEMEELSQMDAARQQTMPNATPETGLRANPSLSAAGGSDWFQTGQGVPVDSPEGQALQQTFDAPAAPIAAPTAPATQPAAAPKVAPAPPAPLAPLIPPTLAATSSSVGKPSGALAGAAKAIGAQSKAASNPLLQGWQANAAALLQTEAQKRAGTIPADTESLERAFMDQAYAELRSRCKALLRDPYRIGFEIVYKNDDASRMVGLFGFRVGSQLFFVPAFFLQAQIKGVDLLYRAQDRMFNPNTEEWVAFLIEQSKQSVGTPVDRRDSRRHMGMDINLDMLAAPPYLNHGFKRASAEDIVLDEDCSFTADDVREMFKAAAEVVELREGLLREFLEEAGPDAVMKFAGWVGESPAFAEAVGTCLKDEDWNFTVTPKPKKQASVRMLLQPTPGVVRADVWFKHAYDIIDEREGPRLSAVYEDTPQQMTEANAPGVWNVMLADGTQVRAAVGYATEVCVGRPMSGDIPTSIIYSESDHYRSGSLPQAIIRLEGDKDMVTTSRADKVFGDMLEDLKDASELKDTVEAKKAYCAIDLETGRVSRPFYVLDKSTANGITTLQVTSYGGNPRLATINPDFAGCGFESGDFGSNVRFVEVGCKVRPGDSWSDSPVADITYASFIPLGNEESLRQWVLNSTSAKQASVRFSKDLDTYTIRVDRQEVSRLSEKAAAVNLVANLGIHGDTTLALLEKAREFGTASFLLEPSKEASMQVLRDPFQELQEYQDPNFGMPLEMPQQRHSPLQWTGSMPPAPRIGDAWDPSMGSGMKNEGLSEDVLLRRSPEEIAQLASGGNLPRVFEHGVIGELVHTFDANVLTSRYIPEIEKGLDHTGRLLFLLYWKPADFERAYGADGMSQMENSVLSVFKSQGQLVLDLRKKSGNQAPNMGASSMI